MTPLKQAAASIEKEYGRLDALVNNVAQANGDPDLKTPTNQLQD